MKITSTKLLLIANGSDLHYLNSLKEFFGAEQVVSSPAELNTKLTNTYDGIIIFAELQFNLKGGSHYFQDFAGISLAKMLRSKYDRKEPILFLSFSPPSLLLKDEQNDIITTVGHDWMELPSAPKSWSEKLKSVAPLNDIQLADVVYNFCSVKGLAGEIFHRLKGEVRELMGQTDSPSKEELYSLIEKRLTELKQLLSEFPEACKEIDYILGRLDVSDDQSIKTFLSTEGAQILALIPEQQDDIIYNKAEKKWNVLFLDDEPNSLKNLIECLEKRGIKSAGIATTVEEAKKMIEEDTENGNNITVVISDFRLYEKKDNLFGGKRQQKLQGYDFLLWLANQDRFNRLVALSGLSKNFLMTSFRKKSLRVNVYSKNDLIGNGINIFTDDIEVFGDEIDSVINNQPTAKEWDGIKPFYIFQRNSKDYHEIEQEISDRAINIITQAKRIIQSKSEELEVIHDIDEHGNLTTNLNGKSPLNSDEFEAYKEKMVARRVAFWLLNCEYVTKKAVAALIQNGKLSEDAITDKFERQVYRMLAFKLSDFPRNITVEERNWFKYYMKVDTKDVETVLSQIGTYFEQALNDYLPNVDRNDKKIKPYIIDGEFVLLSKEQAKSALNNMMRLLKGESRASFIIKLDQILSLINDDIYCQKYLEEFARLVESLKQKYGK